MIMFYISSLRYFTYKWNDNEPVDFVLPNLYNFIKSASVLSAAQYFFIEKGTPRVVPSPNDFPK